MEVKAWSERVDKSFIAQFARIKCSPIKDKGNVLRDERGSLSVVIIGLFFITVAFLMVMSDVATVLVAKRSLAQATEAAAQRGVHTLDKSAYYTGKGTMFTAPLAILTQRDHSPIPID